MQHGRLIVTPDGTAKEEETGVKIEETVEVVRVEIVRKGVL